VALADLPVLTQMALNIAALVATLQSGKQLTPAEVQAIRNISAEARTCQHYCRQLTSITPHFRPGSWRR